MHPPNNIKGAAAECLGLADGLMAVGFLGLDHDPSALVSLTRVANAEVNDDLDVANIKHRHPR